MPHHVIWLYFFIPEGIERKEQGHGVKTLSISLRGPVQNSLHMKSWRELWDQGLHIVNGSSAGCEYEQTQRRAMPLLCSYFSTQRRNRKEKRGAALQATFPSISYAVGKHINHRPFDFFSKCPQAYTMTKKHAHHPVYTPDTHFWY
jgi:hypothetical protein